MCEYVGDGLLRLYEGKPVWQCIPNFNWRAVRDNMGSSQLYDHLVPTQTIEAATSARVDDGKSVMHVVCRVLDLKPEEVSIDVPLTTYGLDSLSAAALSFALRPLFAISQVQLLADLTIKDLQGRLASKNGSV